MAELFRDYTFNSLLINTFKPGSEENPKEKNKLKYHYTSPNALLSILKNQQIYFTDISCKVLLDEIFSRQNFVAHITYERSAVAGLGQGGYLVNTTEHILLYKKGILPNKTNYSHEELGFNIIKRYNHYIINPKRNYSAPYPKNLIDLT